MRNRRAELKQDLPRHPMRITEADGDVMNILIVEDKAENIEAAKRMLVGHDLTIATGFDEALEQIAAQFDPYGARNVVNKELEGTGWKCQWLNEDGQPDGSFEGEEGKVEFIALPKAVQARVISACEPFQPKKFDVVLTDVMYPKGYDRFGCMNSEGVELAEKQGEMPYGPIVALIALQKGVKRVGIVTQGNHHSDPFVFAFDYLHKFELGDARVVASNGRNDCPYLDKQTGELVKYPDSSNGAEYRKFTTRRESGLLVEVKDWKGLLSRLLD